MVFILGLKKAQNVNYLKIIKKLVDYIVEYMLWVKIKDIIHFGTTKGLKKAMKLK